MVERLWSVGDLAEHLGVTKSAVYYWRRRGTGPPAVRVGKFLKFRPSDVDRWLDTRASA